MKLAVLTTMYREAFLAPFFLSHYWFADRVLVLLGASDDGTAEVLSRDRRVELQPLDMPDGFDDRLKATAVNIAVEALAGYDWVFAVDADELVWPAGDPRCAEMRYVLDCVEPEVDALLVQLHDVYRHATEGDLDPELRPVALQRRHGPDRPQKLYRKPLLVRGGRHVRFQYGQHALETRRRTSDAFLTGAHWQNADPAFCVARRVRDRALRLSRWNRETRHGWQHFDATAASVEAECRAHANDPKLF